MAATKKPARKPAAKKNVPAPEVKKTPWRELTGVVFFALGALLVYFLWISESASGVDAFMGGVAGNLRHIVPLIFFYAGLMLIFKANKPISVGRVILEALFILFFFTLFHVFSADNILEEMKYNDDLTFYTYGNFVSKSVAYNGGAGFIGALLTWPIYWVLPLRTVGSVTVLIFLMLADLILMGKISLTKMGEKMQSGFQDYRDSRAQRAAEMSARRAEEPDPFAEFNAAGRTAEPNEGKKAPRAMKIERIRESAPTDGAIPRIQEDIDEEEGVPSFLKRGRKPAGKTTAPPVHIEPPKKLNLANDGINLYAPNAMSGETPVPEIEEIMYGAEDGGLGDFDPSAFEEVDPFADIAAPFNAGHVEKEAPAAVPPKKAVKQPVERVKPAVPAYEAAEDEYQYPPIDLLQASKPSKIKNQEQRDLEKAQKLIETLSSFGISVTLIGIAHGPTVTRYELSPAAGIKVSRITSLADDIALSLAAVSVRIEAPIPGKAAVGVEVPNDVIETVPLRDVLESAEARKVPSRIAAALGRDNAGNNIIADLAKMPHVLIAGATGAGKSVCINCIICSILYRATPEEVRMIMIDPKVVELSAYNGIPHLLVPVVTDPKKAAGALTWAVTEMTSRYEKFANLGVRDIKGYNTRRPEGEPAMPQIVLIIDELADLMMVTPGEVEDAICRLAQLARAAGIHLVIATQRPSVNVITGVIKANIPSRIAFTVASQVDSRTILDMGGAEKLLGRGDMLYAPSGTNKPHRVQGAWISDDEVHDVVEYIKVRHDAEYDEDIIEKMERADMSDEEKQEANDEYDELLPQAIETVIEAGQASISMLQRKLRVGYARAGRLIDEMAVRGIISPAEGAKPRTVLITREQYHTMFSD